MGVTSGSPRKARASAGVQSTSTLTFITCYPLLRPRFTTPHAATRATKANFLTAGMVALGPASAIMPFPGQDRTSVVSGKSVSVRVDLGGRSFLKKKKKQHIKT